MKTNVLLLALALGASTCLLPAQDNNPPSDGQRPPPRQGGPGGPGGPGGGGNERGGPGNPGGPVGFHLLPPRALEQLDLTADQLKQVAALEAETKAKLEKILTPEQMQQLKQMRPPLGQGGRDGRPMGGGPGGQGGPGRRGGPDGQGGPGGPGGAPGGRPPGPPPGDGANQ